MECPAAQVGSLSLSRDYSCHRTICHLTRWIVTNTKKYQEVPSTYLGISFLLLLFTPVCRRVCTMREFYTICTFCSHCAAVVVCILAFLFFSFEVCMRGRPTCIFASSTPAIGTGTPLDTIGTIGMVGTINTIGTIWYVQLARFGTIGTIGTESYLI